MIRISATYVISFAQRMEQLAALPAGVVKVLDVLDRLLECELSLAEMHNTDSLYKDHLRVSLAPANRLYEAIRRITQQPDQDGDIQAVEIGTLKGLYTLYRSTLFSELDAANLYLVMQKDPYSTFSLLNAGEKIFPSDLSSKVPEAVFDAKEAARCLAFELPTACAFHVFRVVERVLRKYYKFLTNGTAPPKVRSISVYVNAIANTNTGDPRVLAALKQIGDLHRNPLIHPEATLSTEDALNVIGMARSVTTAMLLSIPAPPVNTTAASTEPS